jgi:hypothetical protein
VSVDRLVLNGFSARDAEAIQAMFEAELSRQVAGAAARGAFRQSSMIATIRHSGHVATSPDAVAIGAGAARRVFEGLISTASNAK